MLNWLRKGVIVLVIHRFVTCIPQAPAKCYKYTRFIHSLYTNNFQPMHTLLHNRVAYFMVYLSPDLRYLSGVFDIGLSLYDQSNHHVLRLSLTVDLNPVSRINYNLVRITSCTSDTGRLRTVNVVNFAAFNTNVSISGTLYNVQNARLTKVMQSPFFIEGSSYGSDCQWKYRGPPLR